MRTFEDKVIESEIIGLSGDKIKTRKLEIDVNGPRYIKLQPAIYDALTKLFSNKGEGNLYFELTVKNLRDPWEIIYFHGGFDTKWVKDVFVGSLRYLKRFWLTVRAPLERIFKRIMLRLPWLVGGIFRFLTGRGFLPA